MFLQEHSIVDETTGKSQRKTCHRTAKDAARCEVSLPGNGGTEKTTDTSETEVVSNQQDVQPSPGSYKDNLGLMHAIADTLSRGPETSSDDHNGGVIDLRFKTTPIANKCEVNGAKVGTIEKQRTDGLQVITVFILF